MTEKIKNIIFIIYLAIFDVMTLVNIATVIFVVKKLELKEKREKSINNKARKHVAIKTSNYNSAFNRRGYDQFKNEKTGLYEPQKPHQGIELKAKKEE